MKAPPEQQRTLLDIQRLDTELARVARKVEQLPERAIIRELDDQEPALKDAFMQAQRELEDAELEQQRLDTDLALVKERLHRDEAKLDQSVSGKEATALQHEIETVSNRAAQLEDMQFHLLERLDEIQQQFQQAETQLREHAESREQAVSLRDSRLAELEREAAAIREERATKVSQISPELYDVYESTRQRYGIGAALLRGNISEGSNMALTDSDLAQIRETPADELVFCRDSGCILIRTNESAL